MQYGMIKSVKKPAVATESNTAAAAAAVTEALAAEAGGLQPGDGGDGSDLRIIP